MGSKPLRLRLSRLVSAFAASYPAEDDQDESDEGFLVQIWRPDDAGLLSTRGCPFAIVGCSSTLALFRHESSKYTAQADGGNGCCPIASVFAEVELAMPGEAACAQQQEQQHFDRIAEARRAGIHSTLVLAIYDLQQQQDQQASGCDIRPVAVFELAQHEPNVDFNRAVRILGDLCLEVNLCVPQLEEVASVNSWEGPCSSSGLAADSAATQQSTGSSSSAGYWASACSNAAWEVSSSPPASAAESGALQASAEAAEAAKTRAAGRRRCSVLLAEPPAGLLPLLEEPALPDQQQQERGRLPDQQQQHQEVLGRRRTRRASFIVTDHLQFLEELADRGSGEAAVVATAVAACAAPGAAGMPATGQGMQGTALSAQQVQQQPAADRSSRRSSSSRSAVGGSYASSSASAGSSSSTGSGVMCLSKLFQCSDGSQKVMGFKPNPARLRQAIAASRLQQQQAKQPKQVPKLLIVQQQPQQQQQPQPQPQQQWEHSDALQPRSSVDGTHSGRLASLSVPAVIGGTLDQARACSIQLGSLCGAGSFGRVYRGLFEGREVAIKVLYHSSKSAHKVWQEVELMMAADNPNLVKACHFVTWGSAGLSEGLSRPSGGDDSGPLPDVFSSRCGLGDATISASSFDQACSSLGLVSRADSNSSPMTETWILSEFCNAGTLQDAVMERNDGLFFVDDVPQMDLALGVLLGVARGMEWLHDHGVLHGDIKSANVMLTALPASSLASEGCGACSSIVLGSGKSAVALVAKLTDYGLSRLLVEGRSHLSTFTVGTLSHQAPELLGRGRLGKEADVFSFGVLMWEVVMAATPWQGKMMGEILNSVLVEGSRLEFGGHVPKAYRELAESCCLQVPEQRPCFAEITARLQELLGRAVELQAEAEAAKADIDGWWLG